MSRTWCVTVPTGIDTSVLVPVLRLPLPPWLLLPFPRNGTIHNGMLREQHTADLLHDPKGSTRTSSKTQNSVFCYCKMVHTHTLLYRCERVLLIDLVLIK